MTTKSPFTAIIAAAILTACVQPSKPVIGISAGYQDLKNTVRDEYANAVTKAGGIPVIIPLAADDKMATEYMEALDGFILSGGEDIQPAYYGEEVLNASVECNAIRDSSDFRLLKAALAEKIPILAICRGEQLANIYFGGNLYQDLPSQTAGEIVHSQTAGRNVPQHSVSIRPGSRLHELLGVDSVAVNSFHHQAVKVLGDGLELSATAPDGVIEGFEGPGIMCLQFHPEAFVSAGDDSFLPIFEDLVAKAKAEMKSRRARR